MDGDKSEGDEGDALSGLAGAARLFLPPLKGSFSEEDRKGDANRGLRCEGVDGEAIGDDGKEDDTCSEPVEFLFSKG